MSDGSSARWVDLERISKGRYRVRNKHGDTLVVGEGGDGTFTPVELLLTAMAACSAIDVDYIVGKRAEPASFRLRSEGTKVRDDGGNHLTDMVITFDAHFESTDAGKDAQDVFPRAVAQSHDRLCTVVRTVILGGDVKSTVGRVEAP
ncbi:MAG TPA: OsmC family protein [Nocardioidaceae bacterium]|nr:OsmC family protein [Nocardioidaceae bacterium]